MRETCSLSVDIRWGVGQVKVIVDVICHFVRNVNRWVVHVELLVEGLDIELLSLVLELLDLVAVLIFRVLLVSILLSFLILGCLVLLDTLNLTM